MPRVDEQQSERESVAKAAPNGYSPVILNRVSEISVPNKIQNDNGPVHGDKIHSDRKYATASFMG